MFVCEILLRWINAGSVTKFFARLPNIDPIHYKINVVVCEPYSYVVVVNVVSRNYSDFHC